jgi:hypothetical protein
MEPDSPLREAREAMRMYQRCLAQGLRRLRLTVSPASVSLARGCLHARGGLARLLAGRCSGVAFQGAGRGGHVQAHAAPVSMPAGQGSTSAGGRGSDQALYPPMPLHMYHAWGSGGR